MEEIGKTDDRLDVRVSEKMVNFRMTQTFLNHFLWSTEIAYGHMLASTPEYFSNPNQPAKDALQHILTEAWYPNDQGRMHLDETIGNVLKQVSDNRPHIYKAVLVLFASAFEYYLDQRVKPEICRKESRGSWGPYYKSLAIPKLLKAEYPLRLHTVLCADICRRIRNAMVHPPFSVQDLRLEDLKKDVRKYNWAGWSHESFNDAWTEVIGKAKTAVKNALRSGKQLYEEYFYMLYNFTNLDNLAFEIEEALFPSIIVPKWEKTVKRKGIGIRREDLVVPPSPTTSPLRK